MPTVHVDARQFSGVDPGVIAVRSSAKAFFSPYSPYHVESGSDDYEVSADVLSVPLVNGVADVVLPQTPAGQGVWVQFRSVKGLSGNGDRWLVSIPGTDCNLFDLPHLDPATLDPNAPLDPAWVAALEARVPAAGTTGYVLTKGAGDTNAWVAAGGAGWPRYTFTQASPGATWTITHNLNAYPDFRFFLTGAPTVPVYTDVTYPDGNTAVVTWPSAESGRAEA